MIDIEGSETHIEFQAQAGRRGSEQNFQGLVDGGELFSVEVRVNHDRLYRVKIALVFQPALGTKVLVWWKWVTSLAETGQWKVSAL
jgi:hypothetical protein